MKKISITLKLSGLLILAIGLWYGYQEIKFLGMVFWVVSILFDLTYFIKLKLKPSVKK